MACQLACPVLLSKASQGYELTLPDALTAGQGQSREAPIALSTMPPSTGGSLNKIGKAHGFDTLGGLLLYEALCSNSPDVRSERVMK